MTQLSPSSPDFNNEGFLSVEEKLHSEFPRHQVLLKNIIAAAKEKFNSGILFDKETERTIEAASPEEQQLAEFVEDLFTALDKIKSKDVPGHEVAHIHDNLTSALRMIHEHGDLKSFEKFEIIAAVIGHDLGRYNEEALSQTDEKDVEFLVPLLLGRKFVSAHDIKIPENLQMRIIYDIATGGKAVTGHRTAEIVHQADREQLLGSATIPRGIAFDVLLNNLSLSIKKDDELQEKLPTPGSEGDTSQLIQYEFYMRNLYPFQSPEGEKISEELKQEQAVILMLGLHGDQDGLEQIFAPELANDSAAIKHWSKKPIKVDIFKKAQDEAHEFETSLDWNLYSETKLAKEMVNLMTSEDIVVVEDGDRKIKEKIAALTDQEKRGWWAIIAYTKAKRIKKFTQNLETLKNAEGFIEEAMSSRLIPDYQKRISKLTA